MIKNFDELRKQLEDLSSVLNKFNSESVQLRIVELIFQSESAEGDGEVLNPEIIPQRTVGRRKKAPRRKRASKDEEAKNRPRKKATGGRKGPGAILGELIEDGYFQSRRTINSIIERSSSHKARIFKANDISGTLARFVRNGRLQREKNSDGQYEYYT
jgi:hypothetical protein